MLQIVYGNVEETALILASHKYKHLAKDKIMKMPFFLCLGDISSIKDRKVFNEDIEVEKVINKLKKILKKEKEVRIWTSTNSANEYLMMLHAISLVDAKKTIYIADAKCVNSYSISMCNVDDIDNILNYEKKLSAKDINNYLIMWNNLKIENSSMRICDNGILKSVEESFLNNYVLKEIKSLGEVECIKVCANIITKYNNTLGDIGNLLLLKRIDALINDNIITIVKGGKNDLLHAIINIVDNETVIITKDMLKNNIPLHKIPKRLDSATALLLSARFNEKEGLIVLNPSEIWNQWYPFYDAVNKYVINHEFKSLTYGDLIKEYESIFKENAPSTKDRLNNVLKEYSKLYEVKATAITPKSIKPIYQLRYSKIAKVWTLYRIEEFIIKSIDNPNNILKQYHVEQDILPFDHNVNKSFNNLKITDSIVNIFNNSKAITELKKYIIDI